MLPDKASQLIKTWAQEAGFMLCGIAKAGFLEKEASRLENWLGKGYHGKMNWLENHFDLRTDPTKLVPGAKSVICLAYNYYPKETQVEDAPKIARYAYGKDYHFVVKERVAEITRKMQEQFGAFTFRAFTDSAPVMEKIWAEKAGLGWVGKHGLLINKKKGSYFFLAEIICDIELAYDNPGMMDYCGTCNACVEACPTEAILPDKTLHARHCISYLTIELKEEILAEYKNKTENWVFGCDICQEVCPWNRFSTPHTEPEFTPNEMLLKMDKRQWQELTEDVFKEVFKKSAVKRAGFQKLKNSIKFVK